LPKANDIGEEPLPEGIFWLLMTGEIPTKQQVSYNHCSLSSLKYQLLLVGYNALLLILGLRILNIDNV